EIAGRPTLPSSNRIAEIIAIGLAGPRMRVPSEVLPLRRHDVDFFDRVVAAGAYISNPIAVLRIEQRRPGRSQAESVHEWYLWTPVDARIGRYRGVVS